MGQFLENSFTLNTNMHLTKFEFIPGHHSHLFLLLEWLVSCLPKIIVGQFLGEIVFGHNCVFLAWFAKIYFFGYQDFISFAKLLQASEQ